MRLGVIKQALFSLVLLPLLAGGIEEREIKPTTEELLSYHVDEHAFTPKLAKRSFKNYLLRFDPTYKYFLSKEMERMLSQETAFWEEVVLHYQKGKFPSYHKLKEETVKTAVRAQTLRKEISALLLQKQQLQMVREEREVFAETEEELFQRWAWTMEGLLVAYAREKGLAELSSEDRAKVLAFYEKKWRAQEEFYLQEENFPLTVLKAIASSLDAHTMCYSEEEALEIRRTLQKEFCGVGIHLKESLEGPVVSYIVPHSPAEASGRIKVGDIIREIDGKPTEHLYFKKLLSCLVGAPHSTVSLLIENKEGAKEHLVLSREKVTVEKDRIQVEYEPFANGIIGCITLSSFYDNGEGISVEQDLKQAINELKAMGPLSGLILDMRANAGGFLQQAVKVAGLFLQKGTVVIAKYADNKVRFTKNQDLRLSYQGPLLLLTSKASASAAEIVCQALQDEGIAIIVGDERTYGKGSMQYQTITDAEAKHFYTVTIGRYFTPSGKSPQLDGVKSDILLPTIYGPLHMGEKYLAYPLAPETLDSKLDAGQELKKIFEHYQRRGMTPIQKMVPTLVKNSTLRRENNRNLQQFYKQIADPNILQEDKKRGVGAEDLQKREAINIMKDMIFISS